MKPPLWCVLVLAGPAAAQAPPLWSMAGGAFHAECAAIFGLLTPLDPDPALSAQFKAAQTDLQDRVPSFHGLSFAENMVARTVRDWQMRADTVQGRLDLAARLTTCAGLTGAIELP